MSDRVHAGARIPETIRDLHVKNVREKWGREDIYLGTEAELAIREYLDKDDLAALEERLRDRCTSVGCSTSKRKSLVSDSGGGSKPRAMWRVHPELKEELKKFAKENDNTYSAVFALAIREYWTNSRSDRVEQLYDRLETAIEPWEDQIGSDGVNVSVKDRRTAEIAMELGDSSEFLRSELEDAIAEVTSDSDYNRREYTPKVAKYKGVEEHPKNEDLFLPSDQVEEIRENMDIDESGPSVFEQSFDELSSDERVLRVKARLYRKAESRRGKAKMEHSDIMGEFNDEPGQTTGYNIMGVASEANGYSIASPHGTKELRVDIEMVDDTDVIEAATGSKDSSVSSRMNAIALDKTHSSQFMTNSVR